MKQSSKNVCFFVFMLFACLLSNAQTNKTLDSLNLVLKNAKHDTTRVKALIEITENENVPLDTIIFLCNKAINIVEVNLRRENQISIRNVFFKYKGMALNNLGAVNFYNGNNTNAIKYFENALKILRPIHDKRNIGVSLQNLGIIYSDDGNFKKAIEYKYESLKVMEEINDQQGIVTSLMTIASSYESQGNISKALDIYYKSLKTAEKINDKEANALIYDRIGGLLEGQEDLNKALEYFNKSLEIYKKVDNKIGVINILFDISGIYRKQGDSAKALEYNLDNLRKSEEILYKDGIATSLNNIGTIYCEQANYDIALTYFFKSLKISQENGMWNNETSSLNWIGNVYFLQKKYDLAQKYCLNSFQLANKYKSPYFISGASRQLAKIYQSLGKYKQAYEMHVLYTQMVDSLKNEETQRIALKNQLQYEFEKAALQLKQKQTEAAAAVEIANQAALQRKNYWIYGSSGTLIFMSFLGIFFYRNYKQKQKNAAQQNIVLEQKLLRSQMNPHFIFNSLGIIQNYIRNSKNDRAEEYLVKFSKLMRLILENSREEFVPLEKEIETLTYYLNLYQLVLQNGFTYKIDIDETIDTAITCIPPMLAQPFIENALKHGIADKKEGELIIKFKKENETIIFEVTDNGIGYSRSQELKAERADKHKSLATQIVYERLENINKDKKKKIQIKISDIVDNLQQITGTNVQFEIPVVYDN